MNTNNDPWRKLVRHAGSIEPQATMPYGFDSRVLRALQRQDFDADLIPWARLFRAALVFSTVIVAATALFAWQNSPTAPANELAIADSALELSFNP